MQQVGCYFEVLTELFLRIQVFLDVTLVPDFRRHYNPLQAHDLFT